MLCAAAPGKESNRTELQRYFHARRAHITVAAVLDVFLPQRAAGYGAAHPSVGPVPVHGAGRGAPGARVAGVGGEGRTRTECHAVL